MKTRINAIGREVPLDVRGVGEFVPYESPFGRIDTFASRSVTHARLRVAERGQNKVTDSLEGAIRKSGLEDGMTISFHHHLRNGDAVIPMVLEKLKEMGFRNLTFAPSSIPDSHDCVADYIECGLIGRLYTSGVRGKLGRLISSGRAGIPVVIRSHGGRARAIEEGTISIDVAFLAAPTCDSLGNISGSTGPSACGSLGYAITDATYAAHVIAITDNLVDPPIKGRVSIPQYRVDQIVRVASLGDPQKIATGAARITRNPSDLKIAENAFRLMKASGIIAPGFSFQMGAGGASLAVSVYLEEYMKKKGIVGSFGLGGISGHMSRMQREGLFKAIFDVQSFDAAVTESMSENPGHVEIDSSWYANPFNSGCLVHNLDCVILAALDVDINFNVNVLVGNDGALRGASGGHCDTAAGARLSIVALPSFRGGVCSIKDSVRNVTTPGETVDAIVTERGILINPLRKDLLESAEFTKLPVIDIHDLKRRIEKMTGRQDPRDSVNGDIVAVVEYRDGSLIDCVRQVEDL
ncbi:MAG: citrate lyase subunit alpha [Synergistaceae bacterium]|jgi:citrate lyase subunit alpha/citrate CoA-transferase|nr:citrate lyase subunit alpha [Synergistaceae bacterium]